MTLGHSNLEMPDFQALLRGCQITVVCDVRTRPYSFRFPQFNREPLQAELSSARISYEFLGESLGGRPQDREAYREDGRVDYAARRRSVAFAAGIDRILEISHADKAVLLCAEEDPLQCHRFLMICPALMERGITPQHIRRDGVIESQREAEDRLLQLHGFSDVVSGSLFVSGRDSALKDALELQADKHAYRLTSELADTF
jgi:uncharacterized protein (DUF488 family)